MSYMHINLAPYILEVFSMVCVLIPILSTSAMKTVTISVLSLQLYTCIIVMAYFIIVWIALLMYVRRYLITLQHQVLHQEKN